MPDFMGAASARAAPEIGCDSAVLPQGAGLRRCSDPESGVALAAGDTEIMGAFHSRQHRGDMRYDLLPPEPRAARARGARAEQVFEVVDAEFVIIRDTHTRAPGASRSRGHAGRTAGNRDAAFVVAMAKSAATAVLMAAEGGLRTLPARRFAGLVASLCLMVFVLAGGYSAVARGSRVELAPTKTLDITSVNLTHQDANGMPVLLVNAVIENRTDTPRQLSPIRADLVSGGRLLSRTIIAAPVVDLPAGESQGVSTRLPYPGGKLPEVRLSFTDADVSIR